LSGEYRYKQNIRVTISQTLFRGIVINAIYWRDMIKNIVSPITKIYTRSFIRFQDQDVVIDRIK
jgi:hypothetical protein